MANYTLQSHGGEGLYMTADGTPTARRNVYIKARVSDSLDQTWRIDSPSNGARTRIFSCKSNNTGGYALNNATGTNNCDIISHISERGGSPLWARCKILCKRFSTKSRMALESRADSGLNPLITESHGGQSGMRAGTA